MTNDKLRSEVPDDELAFVIFSFVICRNVAPASSRHLLCLHTQCRRDAGATRLWRGCGHHRPLLGWHRFRKEGIEKIVAERDLGQKELGCLPAVDETVDAKRKFYSLNDVPLTVLFHIPEVDSSFVHISIFHLGRQLTQTVKVNRDRIVFRIQNLHQLEGNVTPLSRPEIEDLVLRILPAEAQDVVQAVLEGV